VGPGETELLEFRSKIAELIDAGDVHLEIKLSRLRTLDARTLCELAVAHKMIQAAGGSLVLVAPNAVVSKMLAISRLDTVLTVRRDGEHSGAGTGKASRTAG